MIGATDTVTVVNKYADGYRCVTVPGVFWYKPKAISTQGTGITTSQEPSVIFPYLALVDTGYFTGAYSLQPGTFIIRGIAEVSTIAEINACKEVMTVHSFADHLKGSERIQHITVA